MITSFCSGRVKEEQFYDQNEAISTYFDEVAKGVDEKSKIHPVGAVMGEVHVIGAALMGGFGGPRETWVVRSGHLACSH